MNLPNKLTIFRMLLTPVFLAVFLIDIPHRYLYAFFVFLIAAITDALDGKLAREKNQVTTFGKLTDPLADKMITTASLLALMSIGYCNIWIVMIILAREFAITSVRLVAAAEGLVIPANAWGKAKTATQMVFTCIILFALELSYLHLMPGFINLPLISNVLLWITTVLAVVSGVIYIVNASKIIDFSK